MNENPYEITPKSEPCRHCDGLGMMFRPRETRGAGICQTCQGAGSVLLCPHCGGARPSNLLPRSELCPDCLYFLDSLAESSRVESILLQEQDLNFCAVELRGRDRQNCDNNETPDPVKGRAETKKGQ